MSTFARDLYAGLPPPAECLAILVGVAELTIFGAAGLANPTSFATGFGLPLPSSPTSSTTTPRDLEAGSKPPSERGEVEKTQRALVTAIAARNIEKGLTVLAFACYWRDRRALGTVVVAGLATTVADLCVVKWYGEQEAVWGHVVGMVNCSLIGGGLLYWSRTGGW